MSNAPLLDTVRYNPVVVCTIGGIDYTSHVVSVSSISKSLALDGVATSTNATLKLANLPTLTAVGLAVRIGLATQWSEGGSLSDVHWFWKGTVTEVVPDGYAYEVTAQGPFSNYNPEAYVYTALASSPKAAYTAWINSACSTSLTTPAYGDSYGRSEARVAPPSTTYTDLPGPCTGYTNRDYAYSGASQTSSISLHQVNSYVTTSAFAGSRWTAGCDTDIMSQGEAMLNWHKLGRKCQITMTFGLDDEHSAVCDYRCGVINYAYLAARWMDYTDWTSGNTFDATDTKTVVHTYSTREEYNAAKEYYKNADGSSTWSISRHPVKKEIEIEGVGVYGAHGTAWTKLSAEAQNLTLIDSVYAIDTPTISFEKALHWTFSATVTLGDSNLAQVNYSFTPPRLDSDWTTWYGTVKHKWYRYQEKWAWATIAQDYWDETRAKAAAILGDISAYEGDNGPALADMCPETGTVYGVALTPALVSSVTTAGDAPCYSTVTTKARTPYKSDYEYNILANFTTANSLATDICHGLTLTHGSNLTRYTNQISLSPVELDAAPFQPSDRFSFTSMLSGGSMVVDSLPSTSGFKHCMQSPNGTVLTMGALSSDSYTTLEDYGVRDETGVESKVFLSGLKVIVPGNQGTALVSADYPLLDTFPVTSAFDAWSRVWTNKNRPGYTVKLPPLFASLNPGDVVVTGLDAINQGAPTLALVCSVTLDSGGVVTALIRPMHQATSTDTTNWTNLTSVMTMSGLSLS